MPTTMLTTHTIADLKRFDEAYYNGEALISDSAYDTIRQQLSESNPNDPYFQSVGVSAPIHLSQVHLQMRMGSQQKLTDVKEIARWYKECVGSGEILLMEKLDGASVEITYDHGRLQRVATRGDGIIGSDITENAKRWKNLPHSISRFDRLIIRAEAMLPITAWKEHFSGTANPRNAANGTIMRKSGKNNEHIMAIAFGCDGENLPDRLDARLLAVHDLGLETVPLMICNTLGDLNAAYAMYRDKTRASLDYEIDGLILSCPRQSWIDSLGYKDGDTRPRGQAAYKFPAEKGTSTVTGIVMTMGHTGALIPTAEVAPVKIGGVVISNVLLNNQEFIRDLNINIGDEVLIERAGDVIPYISEVITKNSDGPFKYPTHCPHCETALAVDGRAILCTNSECEGKSFQIVRNWVNKLNIKHLGDGLLRVLYDLEMVKEIPDLYDLTVDSMKSLNVGNGVLGRSMAEKVMVEIDKTREIPVELLMGSVSVKFLGRSMAKHIGLHYPHEYFAIPKDELASKENMGINKAAMMIDSLKARKDLIERILEKVKVATVEATEVVSSKFTGMAVVFTGVRLTKDEQAMFEANGGTIKDSVSKNATHLVQKTAGSESSKTKKAKDLGLTIMGHAEFLNLLK